MPVSLLLVSQTLADETSADGGLVVAWYTCSKFNTCFGKDISPDQLSQPVRLFLCHFTAQPIASLPFARIRLVRRETVEDNDGIAQCHPGSTSLHLSTQDAKQHTR